MTNNFLFFGDIFVMNCPDRNEKDLEHTIWQPFGGEIASLGVGEFPPPKMPGIKTAHCHLDVMGSAAASTFQPSL